MPNSQTVNGWGIDNGQLWPNVFDTKQDAIKWLEKELGMTWKEIQKETRIPKIKIIPVCIVRASDARAAARTNDKKPRKRLSSTPLASCLTH